MEEVCEYGDKENNKFTYIDTQKIADLQGKVSLLIESIYYQ
jgi:hypothetical protein